MGERGGALNRLIIPGVFAVGCLGLLLTLGFASSHAHRLDEVARTPVLVELFTSQGCMSCPPADELLIQLDRTQPVPGALIVPLSEHVEYWNGQWRDPFSSSVFTERQRDYHHALATPSMYTPQMVVDGQTQLIGSRQEAAHAAIAKAATRTKATVSVTQVRLSRHSTAWVDVTVSGSPENDTWTESDLWVAITEEDLETQVERGENAFRRLRYGTVVRALTQVATLPGIVPDRFTAETVVDLAPEWQTENLRAVAFLQERGSRRVLGVAQRRFD